MTTPTCPTCGTPLPADAPSGACPKCLLVAGFVTGSSGPGTSQRAPTPEELAPHFPGLVIESQLGRGGMGVVYRARHKALDRAVALKVLPASLAGDPAFAERFQREARALAMLQHPNIVAIYDFGETAGLFWLVMEFVDGANIRQAMAAGTIHPKEALAIVPQICDALQYAHEHGVVHRDIKPENVLLDKSGRVKVADFGLAKMMERSATDRTLTGAGQVMGTPHYMAPEQWEKPASVDHRADIYSLGVVFYEMLTGELPVGRFAAPSKRSDVDARIDEIVLRTLEREREARYQHVEEVKTDVGRLSHAAPPVSTAAKPRRTWWPWAVAASVLLFCGGPVAVFALFMATSVAPPERAPERLSRSVDDWERSRVQEVYRDVEDLWLRHRTLHGKRDRASNAAFYDTDQWLALDAIPSDERERSAALGELGLPLTGEAFLRGPLATFELTQVAVKDRRTAEATAKSPNGTIRFGLMLTDDGWRFMVSPVKFEPK